MNLQYSKSDIHIFEKKGIKFLFCPNNLAVFEIDELTESLLKVTNKFFEVRDCIKKLNKNFKNEQILKAIYDLEHWGIIAPINARKDTKTLSDTNNKPKTFKPRGLGGLYLCISQDCNLRCKYCCTGYGRFGKKPKLMSKDIAKKAIDILFYNLDPEVTRFRIFFVGGEPLLNYRLIKYIISYIKDHPLRNKRIPIYSMITNGTLLTDEMIDFFFENNVNLSFSIDGPQDIHDRQRVFADGRGSYQIVAANIKKYQNKCTKPLQAQAVLDRGRNLKIIAEHLFQLGFSSLIANPVFDSYFLNTHEIFTENDKIEHLKDVDKVNEIFIHNVVSGMKPIGYHYTMELCFRLHRRIKKPPGCGVGNILAVSADGEFFPCQNLINIPGTILGDVYSGINESARQQFLQTAFAFWQKCININCWARNICGGACVAYGILEHRLDAIEPMERCDLYRKYIESAIYTYYQIESKNPRGLQAAEKRFFQ